MEKNPNSHKGARLVNSSSSWQELPQDLLISVLDRLGYADIRRAESVCSSWYSTSRQLGTKNHIPWLILFPDEDENNNSSCMLFNPEEKDKIYKRQNMGVVFANRFCLATFGRWVLMHDHRSNLYIVNLFTRETINLPDVESQLGTTKLERTPDKWSRFRISNKNHRSHHVNQDNITQSPVFWIDDKTKDYIVVWGFSVWCVVYTKKGDYYWNQFPFDFHCIDMVYKNQSLYLLDNSGTIKILDLSREVPLETFQCGAMVNKSQIISQHVSATKLVVTVTGDVLKVEKIIRYDEFKSFSFRVYKVYSSGVFMKYEQVYSLGNEAMLFDLGITVLANDVGGFKRNSIYFSNTHYLKNTTEICLFNLETQKMVTLHKFVCSSAQQLTRSRWYLPSFTHA